MALRKRVQGEPIEEHETALPPPVEEGYDFVQSLGKVVDEAMRHSRDGAAVETSLSTSSEKLLEPDPEPITPPGPVPDGDDVGTRGADPEDFETK